MAKGVEKPPKLPKGANRAQTQEYLFQLFKQGHPPRLALENLKKAREICEGPQAFDARYERAFKLSDRVWDED